MIVFVFDSSERWREGIKIYRNQRRYVERCHLGSTDSGGLPPAEIRHKSQWWRCIRGHNYSVW